MAFKILIMGLPGSGKTILAKKLISILPSVLWLNADAIRMSHNDWDFSKDGRIRQAKRLRFLSLSPEYEYVVCDFVAPYKESREIFNADYTIWMNTVTKSKFEDTNDIFEQPKHTDCIITDYTNIDEIYTNITKSAISLNI